MQQTQLGYLILVKDRDFSISRFSKKLLVLVVIFARSFPNLVCSLDVIYLHIVIVQEIVHFSHLQKILAEIACLRISSLAVFVVFVPNQNTLQ